MLNPAKASPQSILNQAYSLLERKKFTEAERAVAGLLNARGPSVAGYLALADVYAAQLGKEGHAAVATMMASDIAPDDVAILDRFIERTSHIQTTSYDEVCARTMMRCFDHAAHLDTARLSLAWYLNVATESQMKAAYDLVSRRAFDPDNRAVFANLSTLRPLLNPLFYRGLKHLLVTVQPFEEFLISVRRHVLFWNEQDNKGITKDEVVLLTAHLAQYVFYTDYIFNVTEDEQSQVNLLKTKLQQSKTPDPLDIVRYACYAPLNTLEEVSRFSNIAEIADVYQQQVAMPQRMRELAKTITPLTPIDTGVSEAVQAQYEESPYPRWRSLSRASTLRGWNEMGRNAELTKDVYRVAGTKKIKVLIAGCGTGLDCFWISTVFPEAEITAIDLSKASLSYAMFKAEEYKLSNVRFYQADILKLGQIDERFDFILSGGVLHHLQDTMQGWRVLTGLLKPNGYMMLGFYSKIARSFVMDVQELIKSKGYQATPEDIRRFRSDAYQVLTEDMKDSVLRSADYYTMPTCRDLLFHVQEHNYDLNDLRQMMASLSLKFHGFSIRSKIFELYVSKFPEDKNANSFDNWSKFELQYPRTFGGMYMMWAQK